MTIQSFLKSAALGAGAVILVAGLALAQTPAAPTPPAATAPAATAPSAAPAGPMMGNAERREARQKLRGECREKSRDMKGSERRDSMRKCMSEGRAEGGMSGKRERRAKHKAIREACRTELKDQRFTEAERRTAMQDCIVKKDPSLAKGFACRKEADDKKLERGSREFRQFMRSCNTAR